MLNNKKLFLITLFGLSFTFSGLATVSVKTDICDFDPEHDTKPIIDIFNDNRHLLSQGDAAYYERFLKECHAHPSCTIKTLRENDELAGYIAYQNKKDQGRISDLAVAKNSRNKGHATLLVSTALKELYNNKNVNYVDLACEGYNTPALNLYKKMGFKESQYLRGTIILEHKKSQHTFPL